MKVKDLKADLRRLLRVTRAPKSLMNCKWHEITSQKNVCSVFSVV